MGMDDHIAIILHAGNLGAVALFCYRLIPVAEPGGIFYRSVGIETGEVKGVAFFPEDQYCSVAGGIYGKLKERLQVEAPLFLSCCRIEGVNPVVLARQEHGAIPGLPHGLPLVNQL